MTKKEVAIEMAAVYTYNVYNRIVNTNRRLLK
jgi:hypothetical protein